MRCARSATGIATRVRSRLPSIAATALADERNPLPAAVFVTQRG